MRKDQARDWHGRFVKEEDPKLFLFIDAPDVDPGSFFTTPVVDASSYLILDAANLIELYLNDEKEEPAKLTCGDGLTYNADASVVRKPTDEDRWEEFDKRYDKNFMFCLAVMGLTVIGFFLVLALMVIFGAR